MALNCVYKIKNKAGKLEVSELYEELKSYYKDNFNAKEIVTKDLSNNNIEYLSELKYYYVYDKEFKDWLGFDWQSDNLSEDKLRVLNAQGEPKLFTLKTNGSTYKYFQNLKGEKKYISSHKFSGLDMSIAMELKDQVLWYMMNSNINLEDPTEAINNYNNVIDQLFKSSAQKGDLEKVKEGYVILKKYENDFKQLLLDELRAASSSYQKVELTEDEALTVENEDPENIGDVVRTSAILQNSKDNATANTKLFIRYNVPKIDASGNYQMGKYFPIPKFESFESSWNVLERALADMPVSYDQNGDFQDRYKIIENNLLKFSSLKKGLRFLAQQYSKLPVDKKRQFDVAFNKSKVTFLTNTIELKDGTVLIKNITNDTSDPDRQLMVIWGEGLRDSNYIKKDKVDITDYLNRFDKFLESIDEINSSNFSKINDALNKIGVQIDLPVFVQIAKQQERTTLEVIADFAQGLRRIDGKNVILKNGNFKNPFLEESSNFTDYAMNQAFIEGIVGENTTLGPKGKYWNFANTTYMNAVIKSIQNGDTTYLEELDQSPYANRSLLKEQLRENPESVQLLTFLQGKKDGKGKDTTDLGYYDNMILSINRALADIALEGTSSFNMLANADKSTTFLLKGLEYFRPDLNEDYIDTFIGYIQDELDQYHSEVKDDIYYNKRMFLFPELESDQNILVGDRLPKNLSDTHKEYLREFIQNKISEKVQNVKQEIETLGLEPKEFISSNILSDNNIDDLLKIYVVNSLVNNVEFSKIFTGYPGYYKSVIDFFKRVPATQTDGKYLSLSKGDQKEFGIAVTESIEISSFGNLGDLNKILKGENLNSVEQSFLDKVNLTYDVEQELGRPTTKKQIAENLYDYHSNNIADAQAWITIDRAKFILEHLNEWSEAHEKAFKKVKQGKILDTNELSLFNLQPFKGVHYQLKEGKPYYLKYSQAVLIPSMIKGTQYETMNKMMEKAKIDELISVDGVKTGPETPTKIHDANGNILETELTRISLENRFWKLQQDLPSKKIKQGVLASQIQKNIFINIVSMMIGKNMDKTMYNGKTGNEIVQDITDASVELLTYGENKVKKDLGIDNWDELYTSKINKTKLNQILIDELKSRDEADAIIEALEKDVDYDNIPSLTEKIEQVVASYLKKKFVDIPVNQASLIQVSNFGSNRLGADIKSGIKYLKKEDELKMPEVYKKDGETIIQRGQVLMPSYILAKYVPNYQELTMEELNEMIPEEMLNVVGYRIPNQGMSSNDALEVVGILPPEAGDSIVVYNGLTTKTGSDFDIDKMYMILPNVNPVFEKNNINEIFESYGITEDRASKILYSEGIKVSDDPINELRRLFIEYRLSGTKFNNQKLDQLLSNIELKSFKRFELATEGKEGAQNRLLKAYSDVLTSPATYVDLYTSIDKATQTIKNHVNEIKGDTDNFYAKERMFDPINQIKIRDGLLKGKRGIGSIANHLVNHAITQLHGVRIKDETLDKVYDVDNKNKIADILSGFLNAFVDIAKDPYILDGNFTTFTTSTTAYMLRAGYPIDFIVYFVSHPAIVEMSNRQQLQSSMFYNKYEEEEISSETFKAAKKIINGGNLVNQKSKLKNRTIDNQLVKALFLSIKSDAANLTDIVQSLSFDVYGSGNTIGRTARTLSRVRDILQNDEIINYDNILQPDTIQGKRFQNSVINKILIDQQLFTSANYIDEIYNLSQAIYGKSLSKLDDEQVDALANIPRVQMVKQALMVENVYKYFEKSSRDALNKIKEKYPNNSFVKALQPKAIGKYNFYEINSLRNKSKVEKNNIVEGWREMFEKEPTFASHAVKKAFYQSNFQRGLGTYYEFIPPEYWDNFSEEFKVFKQNTGDLMNQVDLVAEEYARNNPDQLGFYNFKEAQELSKDLSKNDRTKLKIQSSDASYLKMQTSDMITGEPIIAIYKRVGNILDDNGIVNYGVFTAVKPLGYRQSGVKIFEPLNKVTDVELPRISGNYLIDRIYYSDINLLDDVLDSIEREEVAEEVIGGDMEFESTEDLEAAKQATINSIETLPNFEELKAEIERINTFEALNELIKRMCE